MGKFVVMLLLLVLSAVCLPPAASGRPLDSSSPIASALQKYRFLRELIRAKEADFVELDATSDYAPFTRATDTSFEAMAPSQPVPPPAPEGCPPSPSQCDFFFQGNPSTVPTFSVQNKPPDTPISPPVVTSVPPPNTKVGAINTGTVEYICGPPSPAPDNQFYITRDPGVLQARTFQQNGTAPYIGAYVKLPITSAQIIMNGMTSNLNQGQESTSFPIARRCIIFRVG